VPGRATLEVFGLVGPKQDEQGTVQPETYLVASGELLGFMFVVVWFISLIFNSGVVADNPILAHLGYNNFCVGLDTQPAKSPGLILFMAHFYVSIMYAVLNMQRSFERTRMGANSSLQFVWSVTSDLSWIIFLCIFSLVWVINPWFTLYGHTIPFCLFIIARWFTVFARMSESPQTTTRGWLWLAVYTPVSFILPCYYLMSFAHYDAHHELMWPWWVGMILDYTWFACLPTTSLFLHFDNTDIKAVQHIAGQEERDRLDRQASLIRQQQAWTFTKVASAWFQLPNAKFIFLELMFLMFMIAGMVTAMCSVIWT